MQTKQELQKIIDDAPEGAVCVDGGNDYFNAAGVMWAEYCKQFDFHDRPETPYRSLADIKRIAELEQAIDQLEYVGLECIEYVGIANYPCRQAEARARLRLKAVKLKENCNE